MRLTQPQGLDDPVPTSGIFLWRTPSSQSFTAYVLVLDDNQGQADGDGIYIVGMKHLLTPFCPSTYSLVVDTRSWHQSRLALSRSLGSRPDARLGRRVCSALSFTWPFTLPLMAACRMICRMQEVDYVPQCGGIQRANLSDPANSSANSWKLVKKPLDEASLSFHTP